jgi:Thiol:disulfide interchange protein DsbD, N-terminal
VELMAKSIKLPGLAAAGFCLVAVASLGQFIPDGTQSRAPVKDDAVQYLFPEQVTVSAGKSSPVSLHFRIAQGLHINSHTPSDEFLIPTVFSIPDSERVKLSAANYPSGVTLTLPSDPKTKLSVYSGEFIIQAKIVAPQGNHLMQGKLRYQACNDSQCLPPKTITVPIDVIGK